MERWPLAAALGLVLLAHAEVWAGDGSLPLAVVAALTLTTAPVALATRIPYAALVIVHVASAVDAVARRTDEFTVATLLAMMLTVLLVALAHPWPRALPGLLLALAAATVAIVADPRTVAGDHVFAAILLTMPWVAGLVVRHWRARSVELERLGARLLAAQDAEVRLGVLHERLRVARDLHDSTAQALNAVVVHAEAAEEALTRAPDRVGPALHRIQEVARASLADTRRIVEALRSERFDGTHQPRLAQLDRLVDTYAAAGLDVAWTPAAAVADLPAEVDAAAYRVVQECLTNALKHSTSRSAQVAVGMGAERADDLVVRVHAPGPARQGGDDAAGFGLVGMRERVALVGGRLEIDRGEDGFTVTAHLPVGAHA